jgi:hypothetical protein
MKIEMMGKSKKIKTSINRNKISDKIDKIEEVQG